MYACLHHVRIVMELGNDESQLRLLAHHMRLPRILARTGAVLPHVELVAALVLLVRGVKQATVGKRPVTVVDLASPADGGSAGMRGVSGVTGMLANHESFHAEA